MNDNEVTDGGHSFSFTNNLLEVYLDSFLKYTEKHIQKQKMMQEAWYLSGTHTYAYAYINVKKIKTTEISQALSLNNHHMYI